MDVISAEEKDRDRWDEYVLNSSDATPYHLFGWKNVIERTYKHQTEYLMAIDEHSKIRGILPLTIIRSFILGKFAVSVPFCNYGGVCADEASKNLLLKTAKEIMERNDLKYVELRHYGKRQIDGVNTSENNVTMVLDLMDNREILWSSFKAKVRNQVRKAEKAGLTGKFGKEFIGEFYGVYSRNMRDLGTPVHSKKLIGNVLEEFGDLIDILTVWKKDKVIAAMVLMRFKDTLYDLWASSLKEYLSYCPNNMLYWGALEYGSLQGLKYFDFGRSPKESGTFRFKKQWGAKPIPLSYQYLSENREKSNIDPELIKYRLLTMIWKKLPLHLAEFAGPFLRKAIP